MANEKLGVTLLQDGTGAVKAIRVGKETIPVLRAAPAVAPGRMDYVITLQNVDLSYEAIDPPGETKGG